MSIVPPASPSQSEPIPHGRFITAEPPAGGAPTALIAGLIILAVISIGGLAGLYIYNKNLDDRLGQIEQTLQASTQKTGDQFQAVTGRLDQLEAKHGQLAGVLNATQTKLGSAQSDLQKQREAAAALAQQQQQDAQQLTSQLGQLQQQQQTTQGNLGSLNTDVTGVKKDVKSTQDQLAATIAELKTAQGDLGVQSGLIATNGTEIAALRALGDRDIVVFNLTKSAKRQKFGSVQMELKNADEKHQKYTVTLVADDKTIEKKDKTALEPVQFYRVGDHQATEIVVQSVSKDRIQGYISSPKHAQAAPAAAAASKG